MQSDILSLTDYLHAFQVVLQRLPVAQPEPQIESLCCEAAQVLHRVDSARRRQGVGSFEQAEFERLSGQCLPSRVVVWLGECCRRMAAGEGEPLAAHILNLCRGLEWMLVAPGQISVRTHLRIADLEQPFAPTTATSVLCHGKRSASDRWGTPTTWHCCPHRPGIGPGPTNE